MPQRTYSPQSHAFFDNLVTFVASVAALGTAFEVQAGQQTRPYARHEYIAIAGIPTVAGCEFHIYVGPVLDELRANRWPTQVVIDEAPIAQAPPKYTTWLTGLQGVHGSMIANAFVQYFEANRHRTEAKYGSSPQNWPGPWNFGRVIRNAFAHGGKINITNPNASPVAWKTLTYAASQNGRQLLYQDFTAVEVILLMGEMDALL
jgi:hypothetical protein